MYVQYFWNVLYLTRHSINFLFPYIVLMTTCLSILQTFFQHVFEKCFEDEKKVQKSVANKASFQNIFRTSLGHFKNISKMSNC